MRQARKVGYHQLFGKTSRRYWRQGNKYEQQLQERNRDAGKKTIAGLRCLLKTDGETE